MRRRYVFLAGITELRVMGEKLRQEIWMGVESDSEIDLRAFSERHGYHLIPSANFSENELRSIGVTKFVPIEEFYDGQESVN